MDTTRVSNVIVDGIDMHDYPKFCDAFIVSADYDGEPMDEQQLEELNENSDFVHTCVIEQLF